MALAADNVPIVTWAPIGELIPLRCFICGAVYITENTNYIGYRPVYYGDNMDKCHICSHSLHARLLGESRLLPNASLYRRGQWE